MIADDSIHVKVDEETQTARLRLYNNNGLREEHTA